MSKYSDKKKRQAEAARSATVEATAATPEPKPTMPDRARDILSSMRQAFVLLDRAIYNTRIAQQTATRQGRAVYTQVRQRTVAARDRLKSAITRLAGMYDAKEGGAE